MDVAPASIVSSRYEIIAKIASGGMATVYLGALKGPFGFEQLVAIKKLHAHLLDDPNVRESLLMEARLASRIRHANVVDVRDVEVFGDGVQLVMTYIEGATLAGLLNIATPHKKKMPASVAIRIILDICAGLHAAHELVDARGKPLELVHRDVSPQNVLIGIDGIARITDFGVARDESSQRLRSLTGALKGKFAYMAPEYIRGQRPDRRVDVFAVAVVLWEALAGRRLFKGNNDADTISRVTEMEAPRISDLIPELGDGIDGVFEMALSKNPETRFKTTQALGSALETVATEAKMIATVAEVSQFVREVAREDLERLEQLRQAHTRGNKGNSSTLGFGSSLAPYAPHPGELRSSAPEVPPETATVISARHAPAVKVVSAGQAGVPPADKTLVAPVSYRQQVVSMMTDDGQTPTVQESPRSPVPEIAPTLRTPNIHHIERPPPSLAIVSAPAMAMEPGAFSQPMPSSRMGPLGTAIMAPDPTSLRRDILMSQSPASAAMPYPETHEKPSHITLITLPMPLRREDVAPFYRDKRRRARLLWLLAACLVVVLSGVGVALFVAPNVNHVGSSQETKK